MVSKLPEGAVLHGSSNRTHNEIWTISDRVLCMQSSPEVNTTYIKELILKQLYDIGKLDDTQKSQGIEQLNDEMKPMSRHFIVKCMHEFLKTPNIHRLKIYSDIMEEEELKSVSERNIETVVGPNILPVKMLTQKIKDQLGVPTTLCAKDYVVAPPNLIKSNSKSNTTSEMTDSNGNLQEDSNRQSKSQFEVVKIKEGGIKTNVSNSPSSS